MDNVKFPIQPIINGRFVPNRIVETLLNTHPHMNMNTIAQLYFSDEEHIQFAQLIGYSISGYSELSYVTDKDYNLAVMKANQPERDEKDLEIEYLRNKLNIVKSKLRELVPEIFRIHKDDLID